MTNNSNFETGTEPEVPNLKKNYEGIFGEYEKEFDDFVAASDQRIKDLTAKHPISSEGPKVPNFPRRELLDEDLNKIINERENTPESLSDDDIYKKIKKNSVGSKKVKKILKKVIITSVVLITLLTSVKYYLTSKAISDVRDDYVTMEEHEISNLDGGTFYDFQTMGQEIAKNISWEQYSENFDINKEMRLALGLAFKKTISNFDMFGYTKNGALGGYFDDGWAERLYKETYAGLEQTGLLEHHPLPKTLKEFLRTNGYYSEEVDFNYLTGQTKIEVRDEGVTDKQAIANIIADAESNAYNNEHGGRNHG